MRNICNIAEIILYAVAVISLIQGEPSKYWLYFGIGLIVSIVKLLFRKV